MSLYGALFSGVSGLASQSSAMGAISDNITNVNTTGYKGAKVNFQTLVTKQVSLTTYSPGGVQSKPRAAIDSQGLLQATTNSTDLALSGQGMFVVNTDPDPATSGNGMFAYTRAGSFKVDKEGYLQNVSGFYVQGWPLQPTNNNVLAKPTELTVDGNTYMKAYKQADGTFHYVNQNIINPQETKSLNLKTIGGTADQTTQIKMGANLPSGDTIYNPASTSSSGYHQTSVLIYDSLGDTHNFNVNWTKTNSNQWDVETKSNFYSVASTLTDVKQNSTAALKIYGAAAGNTGNGITTLVTSASATNMGYFAGTGVIAMPQFTLGNPLLTAQRALPTGSILNISGASGTASTNNGDWYVSSTVATSPTIVDTVATAAAIEIGGANKTYTAAAFAANLGGLGNAIDFTGDAAYSQTDYAVGDYIKVSNSLSTTNNTGYYQVSSKTATALYLTPADYVTTSTAPYQDQRGVNPPSGAASMDIVDNSTPSLVYASQGRVDFTASSSADVQALDTKSFTITIGGYDLNVYFDTTGTISPTVGKEVVINLNNTNLTSGSDVATLVAQALRNPKNWDENTNGGIAATKTVVALGGKLPLFRANGSTLEIVQQQGGSTAKFSMANMGTTVTQSQTRNWSSGIPSVDTVNGEFYLNAITQVNPAITFNGDGTPKTVNVGKMAVNWANGAQSMTLVPNGTGADQRINWFVGNTSQADGMTQLGGTYQLAYLTQNGAKFGNFSGVSVGTDGVVTALFDNGVRRPVFQIPVATFTNPNGLESLTGNSWIETNTSGSYTLRQANNAGAGSVQSASLEASTVDIGSEFTTMIITQRAYSAAAKIITTADQMLDELVQIKR
ncbi:flagellar hook-basal body complex protein [Paramagnetospirillum magneticum]|uniref:Flagellar hook protein FlgE n=1 Tax=Paramagnetospirillum magneticum (strain ATCC 700264 / AMB-1) TaxID=342108 RepID=Q2WA17_PARM1|nr:flagellar hook-basal body complex protein [Paramagnetospirillum magneticum]BAE49308.1 Flagellar hook protein FlgE [Paramagnetospirillum magneticum AMB-1]